jgi:hypothetical protein
MPERLAQTDAYTQLREVIGSGLFKFIKDEWQPGHKAVYARNPDYAARPEPPNNTAGGKIAKVDRIEMSRTCRMITRRRWRTTRRLWCRAIRALSASCASTSIRRSTTSRCAKRCSRSPTSATI